MLCAGGRTSTCTLGDRVFLLSSFSSQDTGFFLHTLELLMWYSGTSMLVSISSIFTPDAQFKNCIELSSPTPVQMVNYEYIDAVNSACYWPHSSPYRGSTVLRHKEFFGGAREKRRERENIVGRRVRVGWSTLVMGSFVSALCGRGRMQKTHLPSPF